MGIWTQVYEDNVFIWACALSYSWLLALFPFLIFLLTLLPYTPAQQKQEAMRGLDQFVASLPKDSGEMIRQYVDDTLNRPRSGLMSLGLGLALLAASGGMAMTMTAIDRCYDVDKDRPFYIQRPLAMLLTIVVAILMLLVVAILPVGGLALRWLWYHSVQLLGYQMPDYVVVLVDVVRWTLGLFLLMIVMNVVYHFGSRIRRCYRFITPGAVFCILMWVALGLGFRWYVDTIAQAGYDKTYGAVGGVIILLFLMYLAAFILLLGAELNSEIDYAVYPVRRGELDFRPAEKAYQANRRAKRTREEPEAP